jgi:RNA polymerase sigma-70 factor (ECF subfamily)
LYREQFPRLLRFFSRRTRCPEEARDLVHEVFSRLLRLGFGRQIGLEKPEAYLSRVASNLLKDRARTLSRRSAYLHVVTNDGAVPAVDQQNLLETRDMLNRLEAAMLRLKPGPARSSWRIG